MCLLMCPQQLVHHTKVTTSEKVDADSQIGWKVRMTIIEFKFVCFLSQFKKTFSSNFSCDDAQVTIHHTHHALASAASPIGLIVTIRTGNNLGWLVCTAAVHCQHLYLSLSGCVFA